MKREMHGITFIKNEEKKHTYSDWGLVPTARPDFGLPQQKEKFQDIPGKDGVLDYSEAISGRVNFFNRTNSIEFLVTNKKNWVNTYSSVANFLHGKRMKAVLDDDPDFFYEGKFSVSEWKSDAMNSFITIDVDVFPYKRKLTDTVIKKTVSGTMNIICPNLREPVVPTVEVSDSMTIKFGSSYSKSLEKGKHLLDVVFEEGENILNVTGNGTITITYREGSL